MWQAASLWSQHQNRPHSTAHLRLFCLLWTACLLNNLLVRLLRVSERDIALLWQLVARKSEYQPLEVPVWWGWWSAPPPCLWCVTRNVCAFGIDSVHVCTLGVPLSVDPPAEIADRSIPLTWRLLPQCEGQSFELSFGILRPVSLLWVGFFSLEKRTLKS